MNVLCVVTGSRAPIISCLTWLIGIPMLHIGIGSMLCWRPAKKVVCAPWLFVLVYNLEKVERENVVDPTPGLFYSTLCSFLFLYGVIIIIPKPNSHAISDA